MSNTIKFTAPEDPDRKELKEVLERFDAIGLEDYRPYVLGKSNKFSHSSLYSLGNVFRTLNKQDHLYLPTFQVKRITGFARQALELFDCSKSETITPEELEEIVASSQKLYEECFGPVSSAIVYSVARSYDPQKRREEAERLVGDLNKKNSDAAALLKEVKEKIQKVTVAQEAVHFQNEANRHKHAAYIWLAAAAVLAAVTFGFAWENYSFYKQFIMNTKPEDVALFTTAQSIQTAVAKLLLFSLLIGALVWCGRVYRAHRHNYVVNKHRQNALGTFNTFVNSAQDQQTKNAVLLQATHCIFTPQPSGYVPQESEASGYPQILEIVKGVMDGKDKA